MSERFKTFLIGIFVLCALFLAIGVVVFLKPSFGDGQATLRVRFPTIEKVTVGTRVTFAGKPIGEVIAINEIREARTLKENYGDQVYFFELVLSVDSATEVYETDDVVIQTSGLFGEKSIAIIPKPHLDEQPPQLMNDHIIYSKSASSLQETIKQMSSFAETVQSTLSKLSEFLTMNNEELKNTISSFNHALTELNVTLAQVNQQGLIKNLDTATNNFSNAMASIDLTFKKIDEQNLIDKMGTTFNDLSADGQLHNTMSNLAQASESIKKLAQAASEEKSSLGKLITSDDFYLRAISLTDKVEVLLNDVNHYGLLFHLDKGWQRTRTKRRNLLENLSSPSHFTRFFEEEMDQITTSLSRTSLLLEKAEHQDLYENIEFKESYADLLRRVESLEAHLKLYTDNFIKAR